MSQHTLAKRPPAPLLHVTDHAILRWLQRKHGVDVDAVYEEIKREVTPCFVPDVKNQAIKKGDHCFVITDGRVVTVLPRNGGAIKRFGS